MREIRQSGLEGGVRLTPHPYPYQAGGAASTSWQLTDAVQIWNVFFYPGKSGR